MLSKIPSGHLVGYAGILLTVAFTVYGQVILKWQAAKLVGLMERREYLEYLLRLLINPWVLSSLFAAFLAFLSWSYVLTKLQLSHAYPFTAISFVLVLILSAVFFHEGVTTLKVIGILLVVSGLVIGSQG